MNGIVDGGGRALLDIELRRAGAVAQFVISAWIDTGFTGDLVLSQKLVDLLALSPSGSVDAILADGSVVPMYTYSCVIYWFGRSQQMEVVANDGEYALLGVGLLNDRELFINYGTKLLTLN
jgi:clan AA aspartic protease